MYSTLLLGCINRLSTSTQRSQSQKLATPPPIIDLDCAYYDMTHEQRGLAIIFNHFAFDSKKYKHLQRNGTEQDCKRLEKTFHELGFKVERYNDRKRSEINTILNTGNICNIVTFSFLCFYVIFTCNTYSIDTLPFSLSAMWCDGEEDVCVVYSSYSSLCCMFLMSQVKPF